MIFVHDVTIKIFLQDMNYIVDAVIWPKFVNSSISMGQRKARWCYHNLICIRINQKNQLFWGVLLVQVQ